VEYDSSAAVEKKVLWRELAAVSRTPLDDFAASTIPGRLWIQQPMSNNRRDTAPDSLRTLNERKRIMLILGKTVWSLKPNWDRVVMRLLCVKAGEWGNVLSGFRLIPHIVKPLNISRCCRPERQGREFSSVSAKAPTRAWARIEVGSMHVSGAGICSKNILDTDIFGCIACLAKFKGLN
jgi:hypothetical protein